VSIDPVPASIAALAVAWLFAHAAWHKLRAFREFTVILASYRLMPAALVTPAAALLAAIEAAIAVGAVLNAPAAFYGAAALLGLYALAIAVNLVRDRALLDCGCGGPPQPISGWLVLRNLVLIGVAACALLPTSVRTLGLLDLVSIGAGVLFAGTLYAAANALHAARAQQEEWV
jgi:hypothetical protein